MSSAARLACCAAALGAALALIALAPSPDAGTAAASQATAGGIGPAVADRLPAHASASLQGSPIGPAEPAEPADHLAIKRPAPSLTNASITLTGPSVLHVGEQGELVVGLGPNLGVRTLSVSVRFDRDVLQARMAAPGTWAARHGADTSFAAEIAEDAARADIHSTVSVGAQAVAAGGSVAVLQFQAVAPGVSEVTITEARALDQARRPVALLLPMPAWRVTAVSPPTPVLASVGQTPNVAPEVAPEVAPDLVSARGD